MDAFALAPCEKKLADIIESKLKIINKYNMLVFYNTPVG